MSTDRLAGQNVGQHELEQLSAFADGELSAVAQGALLAAMARDGQAQERWAAYHRIGDAMRGGSSLAGSGQEQVFLASFRERLAAEPRPAWAPAPAAEPQQSAQVVPLAELAQARRDRQQDAQTTPARRAANDGMYRWKMVAGLATVMAVLVVGWSVLDESTLSPAQQPTVALQTGAGTTTLAAADAQDGGVVVPLAATGTDGPVLPVAVAAPAPSAVALVPQGALRRVSQPGLVAERPGVTAVGSRYALQAANDGLESVMIRDPQLDEFLAAHRQGNASALQTPVDFVRDVVVQPAP